MSPNHPLPAPPGQPQRPEQQRARTRSSFSFHSHKSSGSGPKVALQETHQEKESRRITSKADPSMAITEAEPSAVASREKSSLSPIRAIQHRDNQGNPIADPDRSNPTRSRWERPLDTIRSFEAAIDGNYNRKSYMRTESADAASNAQRRSSYYAGNQGATDERPRYYSNGYYGGGRAQSYRPDSTYIEGKPHGTTRGDGYYNNGENGGPSNGYHPNRARYPRTASEPQFNNGGGGVYTANGNQQSYETVATTSGSGSSPDHVAYSTDPSSENSSMDRVAPLPPKDPSESYGFGKNPQYLPPGSGIVDQLPANGAHRQGDGYLGHGPAAVPKKSGTNPKVLIKLGATSGNAQPATYDLQKRPSAGEKRKSWFGKRFSKA